MKRVHVFLSAVLNVFLGGFPQTFAQTQGQERPSGFLLARREVRQQPCQSICFSELLSSDQDQDGRVNSTEYLDFGQQLGLLEESLPLSLQATFNLLACLCVRNGLGEACCSDGNAHIDIELAQQNEDYLCSVCWITEQGISQTAPSVTPADVLSTYPTLWSQLPSMVPSSSPIAASHAPSVSPSPSSTPSTTSPIPTASPADNIFRQPTAVPSLDPHEAPFGLHLPSMVPSSSTTSDASHIYIVASLPPSIPSVIPNPSVGDSDNSTATTVGISIAAFGGLSFLCLALWSLRRVSSRSHLGTFPAMSARAIQDDDKECLLDIETVNGNMVLQMYDKSDIHTIEEEHEFELDESRTESTSPSSQQQSNVPGRIELGQDSGCNPPLPPLLWDYSIQDLRRHPGASLRSSLLSPPIRTGPLDSLLAPMDTDSFDESVYDEQPALIADVDFKEEESKSLQETENWPSVNGTGASTIGTFCRDLLVENQDLEWDDSSASSKDDDVGQCLHSPRLTNDGLQLILISPLPKKSTEGNQMARMASVGDMALEQRQKAIETTEQSFITARRKENRTDDEGDLDCTPLVVTYDSTSYCSNEDDAFMDLNHVAYGHIVAISTMQAPLDDWDAAKLFLEESKNSGASAASGCLGHDRIVC